MQLFNLHTHQFTANPEVLELVNQYPNAFDASVPFYSIGIHPWYIDESRIESDLAMINSKLALENCLALGECGLDKRIETPMALQTAVFKKQLALAQKHKKPVILHCVGAFQEVIVIKKELNSTVPMVIHGFSKNEATAKQLLENGFYLSFGKYLLQNPELKSVFKEVPNNRFFLETDTVEESIGEVYALAAKYKNIERQEVVQIIKNNCSTVFGTSLKNQF